MLKSEAAKVIFAEAKENAFKAKHVNDADKMKRKIWVASQIEALA